MDLFVLEMVNSSDTDLHFDDRYESFGTYTVPACLPDHDIEIAFGMWLGPMVSFKVYRGKDFGKFRRFAEG